jgi:hypothetical protein
MEWPVSGAISLFSWGGASLERANWYFQGEWQRLKVYTHGEPIGENTTIFFVDASTFIIVDAMTISPREDHKSTPKVSTKILTSPLKYEHFSPDWVQNTENMPPKL